MDASLDKLDIEAETHLERTKEINRSITRHTPAVNTPGSVLSLSAEHKLTNEVSQVLFSVSPDIIWMYVLFVDINTYVFMLYLWFGLLSGKYISSVYGIPFCSWYGVFAACSISIIV